MDTIICPKCSMENPAIAVNCKNCGINLQFALEHPEEIEKNKLEGTTRSEVSTPPASTQQATSVAVRIALGALALIIGLFGIVPLFIVGEGSGNGILAFAVVALIFALLAFGFASLDPGAWWAYALIICLPITLLSLSGGVEYFLVTMLMLAITLAGAYFGQSLKSRK
jgi:4-amino-4-deoxy-L-arabinose transferase-like glycosyltransferase